MTTSEKLKRLEDITIPHFACIDGSDSGAEQEARSLFADLQRELQCCGKGCQSWCRPDDVPLTPVSGRCKKVTKNGVNAVVFDGDPCLLNQEAAA